MDTRAEIGFVVVAERLSVYFLAMAFSEARSFELSATARASSSRWTYESPDMA
jgi:hypothetical protein